MPDIKSLKSSRAGQKKPLYPHNMSHQPMNLISKTSLAKINNMTKNYKNIGKAIAIVKMIN